MNVERILKLADAIESHALNLGFNMRFYVAPAKSEEWDSLVDHSGHSCGTVACIAGWGHAVMTGKAPDRGLEVDSELVRAWLGLSEEQKYTLFTPESCFKAWRDITQEQAVATLRHLAATGEVDWGVTP